MQDEVRQILNHLRPRDAFELSEYGFDLDSAAATFAAPCVLAKTFAHDGAAHAVVTFHALTPKALAVSLLATDHWPRVARAVLTWGVRVARPGLLSLGFERAECRTLEGHADAIRFLERLGFARECRIPHFGATGASFVQYTWRLNDHVPVQSTQSPATAATSATA